MMNQRFVLCNVSRWSRLLAGAVIAVLFMTLLAACESEDGTRAPGQPVTPAAASDQPGGGALLALPASDPRGAAYSPDGSQIAISSGATVYLYSPELERQQTLAGHSEPVRAVAWSPDGARVVSASLDQTVRVWDVADGSLLATLTGHTDWVMDVAWSPDGGRIASSSTDGTVRLWDAESGAELAQMGTSRVQSITVRFQVAEVFDAISDLDYAQTVLDTISAEPLSDLVAQVMAQEDYAVTVAFDDPLMVTRLLALNEADYELRIMTGEDALQDDLDALTNAETRALVLMFNDPQVDSLLDEYAEAEATIAAINAREDAEYIRAVRRLQEEAVVIRIEQADGETITANPQDEDFIATIAELGAEASLSFGIEDEAEITARLQDPDFVAAVQQLDAAQDTIATLTAREDAEMLLLVRRLLVTDYTVQLANMHDGGAADWGALDTDSLLELVTLLQNETLIDALVQLDSQDYVIQGAASNLTGPLAPLAYTVTFTTGDAELDAAIAALEQPQVVELADLVHNRVLRYAIEHQDQARSTISEIEAREDYTLITVLRQLETPRTVETIISAIQGTDEIRVTRRIAPEEYVLSFEVADEDTILALSALSTDEIAAHFAGQSAEDVLALIDAGVYTVTPALETDAVAEILARVGPDTTVTDEGAESEAAMFAVGVQYEANAHTNSVTAVAWSPDGAHLASISADLSLRVWEPDTGILAGLFELDEVGVSLAWSPDSTLLASGTWDNNALVWDAHAGIADMDITVDLDDHDERVTALAWSPDGAYLATASRDGIVMVWDVAAGESLATLPAHTRDILAMSWSPDGARLLTAGLDGYVRLWDAAALLGA